MTKEEHEKAVADLEKKVVDLTQENADLKKEVESWKAKAPKGAKKTKKVVGLKAAVLHSGKFYAVGTKKEDLPAEVVKLHEKKIGEVEIED